MRIVGDCRDVLPTLPKGSVQMVCTSPPYWGLRDYGVKRQIGLERTPEEFVATMIEVFRLVREVLADDGTLWLNLGDSYATGAGKVGDSPGGGAQGERFKRAWGKSQTPDRKNPRSGIPVFQPNRMPIAGLKPKDLCGMPWRVAFALQADGWYLRSDIIWHKPNPMPESVTDRPTKAHEYLFLLTKGPRYHYDAEAVREPQSESALKKYNNGNWERQGRTSKGLDVGVKEFPSRKTVLENGRNRRTVWTIATSPFKKAHFATFPPKLVEPCILAGTSERGHCPECGKRWERVVAGSYELPATRGGDPNIDRTRYADRHETRVGYRPEKVLSKVTNTLGFRPTCQCGRKPVPDVVLDPFAGAGTTGMVAEQLGRKFVGIELNPRYSKLAREAA